MPDVATYVVFAVVALIVISILRSGLFTVHTQQTGVLERFGRFQRTVAPGLNFKVPFFDKVRGVVSLSIQQIEMKVDTKTKDNVFVSIPVAVQFHILADKVQDAFYKVADPAGQIKSFVFNSVLAHIPTLTLDEAFEQQPQITQAVTREIDQRMQEYGYVIDRAMITDIVPDPKVAAAMNEINAAQREQVAAQARGEAEKILVVKKAEAEAASKALQGKGIADQRKAIVEGLKESVAAFSSATGVDAQEVMSLVLMTQYFDAIRDIGQNSNTILFPHTPGAVGDLMNEIRQAMMVSNATLAAGGQAHAAKAGS